MAHKIVSAMIDRSDGSPAKYIVKLLDENFVPVELLPAQYAVNAYVNGNICVIIHEHNGKQHQSIYDIANRRFTIAYDGW